MIFFFFLCLFIHLLQSDHSTVSLFWVHTDVVIQINSGYVYFVGHS